MKRHSILTYLHYFRRNKFSDREFLIILSVVAGLGGGLIAYILKTSVYFLHESFLGNQKFDRENLLLLLYPVIGISLTVSLRKFILNDKVKHNIAAILQAISIRKSLMKKHKIFSSALGGILTAGFGGSVGLESPIISSGAAIGSYLGRVLRLNYKTVTTLLACGAAGAISAIFNTPIAAIVFALEVLNIDLTRFSLIPLLVSSICGALFPNILFSEGILFEFVAVETSLRDELPFYLVLAGLTGLFSVYFTRTFVFIEKQFERISTNFYRLLIGGVFMGGILFLFPELYGEGYVLVKSVLRGEFHEAIQQASTAPSSGVLSVFALYLALLMLKVIATAITLGSGGVGGIFAPSLFSGAILGTLFVAILKSLGIAQNVSMNNFSLVGMAGVLSGVLHAPLTAIFLIAEMTKGHQLIVPLMTVSTIAYLTSKYIQPDSIFTVQLAKRGELITHHKDKAILTFLKLQSVLEKDIKTVKVGATLGELVKVISKSKRNLFPVIDEDNILHGVIYIENIREIMFNTEMYDKVYVEYLMDLPPAYVYINDSMEQVMKKFSESNAWNLPVIDEAKYVGFVSKSKLFSAYRGLLLEISED